MPSSDPVWLDHFTDKVIRDEPKSVLDIGIGFGLGGMLIRQYGDVWCGRCYPQDWAVKLDGIELFEPYLMPHQRFLYDSIYVGAALDVLPTLGGYDLILCADVIEHLEKPESERLMGLIAEHGKTYLVTTPGYFFAQEAIHGNSAEAHLCEWTEDELAPWGQVSRRGNLLMVER